MVAVLFGPQRVFRPTALALGILGKARFNGEREDWQHIKNSSQEILRETNVKEYLQKSSDRPCDLRHLRSKNLERFRKQIGGWLSLIPKPIDRNPFDGPFPPAG